MTNDVDVVPAPAEDQYPESPIADPYELMLRQVHPVLFDVDGPVSTAFMPNSHDDGQLSVDRSSLITARDAYELYVGNGLRSGGVYGISVGEFGEHDLNCYPDPLEAIGDRKANRAHARVDYSAMGKSKRRSIAQRLKKIAVGRGVLHKP